MKKSLHSNRSKKWIQRNDLNFPLSKQRISHLCSEVFHFEKWEIKNKQESAELFVYFLNKIYIVRLNKEDVCLELFLKTEYNTILLSKYYNDSCWNLILDKIYNEKDE